MRCRCRSHFVAGTYYASRRTEPPQLIFSAPKDYEDFEVFLAHVLERTGTRLLGYCWMPDAIHLALAIGATPVDEMMLRVTRYCSQRILKRTGARVNYTHSLPIRLSEPETHLPMLLRYFDCIPVIAGAAESPGAYSYTSRAYVGVPQDRQLRTTALQTLTCVPLLH